MMRSISRPQPRFAPWLRLRRQAAGRVLIKCLSLCRMLLTSTGLGLHSLTAIAGLALQFGGVAMVYLPAAMILTGSELLAVVCYGAASAGRVKAPTR